MDTLNWQPDYGDLVEPPFRGRERELSELKYLLTNDETPIVRVLAVPGMGKSRLVREFARANAEFFTGGFLAVHAQPGLSVGKLVARQDTFNHGGPSLLLIDDAEGLSQLDADQAITEVRSQLPNARIVLAARPNGNANGAWPTVQMDGLSPRDFAFLEAKYGTDTNVDTTELFNALQGSPIVSQLLQSTHGSPSVLSKYLKNFKAHGLVTADGRPISELDQPRIEIIADVGESMIREIRKRPELIHQLNPRKFEEFVAELLRRNGFDVQLTPRSKDGGLDMFVREKNALGTFLYLVECKKYRPDRPVQVKVVRELFGTLYNQQANAGILVTTSQFTKGAKEFQQKHEFQLQLKDYVGINEWLHETT